MKKILLLLGLLLPITTGCQNADTQTTTTYESEYRQEYTNFITIKYRSDSVDIASSDFQSTNTSKSSFIRGAWYDSINEYLILNLNGVNYQYCGIGSDTWYEFKGASSFGSYYNSYIKGNYDCRYGYVPSY